MGGGSMSDKKRVVSLATSGQPDDLAAAVGELRMRLPGRIEYQRIMARLQREAYLAYVAEGFTQKQALELCKSIQP